MGGLRRAGAVRREEIASTAGELGVEGDVVEDVGEGGTRGGCRGSFTLPSKGREAPGAPGWCRGAAWRGK